MLTEQLSTNNDLVEALDTEPVFDYLLQHGVLNTDVVDGICNENTKLGRNSALLQHLDDNGGTARALFINALRQSGQHKLASTIDTSQRIKPATGYWDKPRHKGEVKIKIGIKSLKLLVPKTDSPENDKRKYCVASDTPQKLHKSYENMLMLDNLDTISKSRKIAEYSYDKDEEDEIPVKKSCWCMCFPLFCRPKKKKEKKYEKKIEQRKLSEKERKKKQKSEQPESRRMLEFTEKSLERRTSDRGPSLTNKDTPNYVQNQKRGQPLSSSSYDQQRNSGSPRKELQTDMVVYKNHKNDSKRNVRDKENVVPIIMQYDNKNESVELRVRDRNMSPRRFNQTPMKKTNTNNNGTVKGVEMCEKWKSDGSLFEEKLTEFCALFELKAMQDAITKYFECDRGTLFFESGDDGSSVYVCNICTSVKQLKELEKDYKEGKLQSDLYKIMLKNDIQIQMAVPGVEFSTQIEDDQFTKAHEELA